MLRQDEWPSSLGWPRARFEPSICVYLERWNAQNKKPALRRLGVDEIFLVKAMKFVTVVGNLGSGEPLDHLRAS